MVARLLQTFEPFAQLEWSRLCTLARHARLVAVPAGRWLVRPGRELVGSCYLVQGRLRLLDPAEVVQAGTPRARRPVYPGPQGVQALTAVRLLRVHADPVAFLLGVDPTEAPAMPGEGDDWELRFLRSGVMQRLSPMCWQQLLRSMVPLGVSAGELIVRQGDAADAFYVLTRGRAQVRRAGVHLAQLQSGDFFGEDALITGACRNADVCLLTDGVVMRLGSRPFLDWLLSGAVCRVPPGQADSALGAQNHVRAPIAGEQLLVLMPDNAAAAPLSLSLERLRESLDRLDPNASYLVTGASLAQRALAGFILTHKGFDVRVVDDAPP